MINSEGHATTLSSKLSFPYTNNVVEYEVFLSKLVTVQVMGVKKFIVIKYSNLVINQVNGDFAVKDPSLALYKAIARNLMAAFQEILVEHVPRLRN